MQAGSSPRVRGKPANPGIHTNPEGLIPACAGKTECHTGKNSRERAHPRVCGENREKHSVHERVRGSSPRVRGKPQQAPIRVNADRLIPACAGKTIECHPAATEGEAHPRVCGENSCESFTVSCVGGSSPRVRGKLSASSYPCPSAGLIPACAGKTTIKKANC